MPTIQTLELLCDVNGCKLRADRIKRQMEEKIPFYHFYYHVIVNQKLSFLDICLLPAQHSECSYGYILMMKMCTDCIMGRR